MRVGILDRGGAGRVPPSAAVRAHRRARHVTGHGVRRLDPARYTEGLGASVDTLLVVRDAVASDQLAGLRQRLRRDGTRLVVDVDDDLVTGPARERLVGQGYDGGRLDALAALLQEADLVLVSTPHLATLVEEEVGRETVLLPNELDPLLWAGSTDPDPPPVDDERRVLYMGSRTHDRDLALLDDVFKELSAAGTPVVLEVVGVTAADLPAGTRRLVPGRTHYAGFVRWLREQQARWDAAVAPLAAEPFNLAKSDLKLLEYAALELPCVASPVGPYATAPRHLTSHADTRDEWVARLADALAVPPGARRAARGWVLEHRTLTPASVQRWVDLLLS